MTTKTNQGLRNPLLELVELGAEEKVSRGMVYTPREIWQQPDTWLKTYSLVQERREEIASFLEKSVDGPTTVYVIGAGTSDYVGRALTSILRQCWKCDVIAMPSTELITNMENYVLPGKQYLWISFSRSGDSSEGVGVLEMALREYPQVRHVVITCNKNGEMSRMCAERENAYVLVLDDAVNDRGLAMTSSFSNMVLAGQCMGRIAELESQRAVVDQLTAMGKKMLAEAAPVAESVSRLECRKVCFVGSGALTAVATECALKALELTAGSMYAMAESTMGLRHGPMSALDGETLIVSFLSGDERRRRYEVDLLEEIAAKRLGRVRVAVAPAADDRLRELCDHVIAVGAGQEFEDDYRAPVDVIFGQMLGLFASIQAGLQPDHPSPNGTINRVVQNVKIYR